LAESEIVVASPPNSDRIRQVAAQDKWFDSLVEDLSSKYFLILEDQGPASNTMCHWTPQVYLPNGF